MKSNYYVKVGNFYLNFYNLDRDSIDTNFISDIELDSKEENAYVFETFNEACKVSDLLEKLLMSDKIYVVEELEKEEN